MTHLVQKQALATYGLPFGSYSTDKPARPACSVCNLELPLAGECC